MTFLPQFQAATRTKCPDIYFSKSQTAVSRTALHILKAKEGDNKSCITLKYSKAVLLFKFIGRILQFQEIYVLYIEKFIDMIGYE